MTQEKIEKFLEALTALCVEHGVKICGCGCCGSPYISEMKPKDEGGRYQTTAGDEDLKWVVGEGEP